MEEKEYASKTLKKTLCSDCIHNYFNNGEGVNGCRAFPNGIPEFAEGGYAHRNVLKSQIGEYVFKLAKYDELTPIGKYFWRIRHKQ